MRIPPNIGLPVAAGLALGGVMLIFGALGDRTPEPAPEPERKKKKKAEAAPVNNYFYWGDKDVSPKQLFTESASAPVKGGTGESFSAQGEKYERPINAGSDRGDAGDELPTNKRRSRKGEPSASAGEGGDVASE